MEVEKKKEPLGRRLHAIAAGLMIVGSPFAAFWSFGASLMFLLVGLLWLGAISLVMHAEDQREKEKAKSSETKLKSVA
jgi:hypothetical protein